MRSIASVISRHNDDVTHRQGLALKPQSLLTTAIRLLYQIHEHTPTDHTHTAAMLLYLVSLASLLCALCARQGPVQHIVAEMHASEGVFWYNDGHGAKCVISAAILS